MLKLLSRITGRGRAEIRDARRLYAKIMTQSRNPAFFTPELIQDDFDGRMELLALNMSVVMHRLRGLGDNGQRLQQALYDVMVDDFDVALRQECLTDTGVGHRIKPMAKMVLTRAKFYGESLSLPKGRKTAVEDILKKYVLRAETTQNSHIQALASYVIALNATMQAASLGEIALGSFAFPEFTD